MACRGGQGLCAHSTPHTSAQRALHRLQTRTRIAPIPTTRRKKKTAPFCASADAAAKLALDPAAWTALKLREKAKLTHNTWRLKFELPPGTSAALPVASCLVTKATLPGDAKPTIRPYTPVSAPDGATLDLVVKGYPTGGCAMKLVCRVLWAVLMMMCATKTQKNTKKGKLSKHIVDLPVGASLDFKGPIPKYDLGAPNKHSHIGMVAGGSGLTPMLQVAEELLARPGETTKLSLIFANQSEADIILKVLCVFVFLFVCLFWGAEG